MATKIATPETERRRFLRAKLRFSFTNTSDCSTFSFIAISVFHTPRDDAMTDDEDYDAAEEATYLAIGRFIRRFSSIEFTMRYYLAEAVGMNLEYTSAIITHDFALLCTAVTTVYSKILKTDEERKILKQLISKCRAMNDLRVKVVHGHQWFPGYNGGMVAHVSRQTLQLKDTPGMTEILEKAAKEGSTLFWELQHMLWVVEDEEYMKR